MKRIFTLIALGTIMAAQTVRAQETVTYVTNKTEFTNAFNAHPGTPGSVSKIILAGQKDAEGNYPVANREVFNIGNFTPSVQSNADGTIIICSEQNEMDKQPILQFGLNLDTQAADSHFSLVFENVQMEYRSGNLATSGQIIYWNKKDCHADSIIFRNCNITNIPRSLIRTVPAQTDGVYNSDNTLNRFVMEGCRVFDNDITSGNNWPIVYLATKTAEVTFRNNMFYNLPYSKQILTWNYCEPTGENVDVNFENNLVVASRGTWRGYDGTEADGTFDIISVGAFLGNMASYNFNNNIVLTPEVGVEYTAYGNRDQKGTIMLTDLGENPSKLIAATGGMVFAENNVVEGYAAWSAGNNKDEETGERTWIVGPGGSETPGSEGVSEGRIDMATAGLAWSDFYDAHGCDFRLLKSHPLYAQNIGPAMMYVDKFPVRATVTVNIQGSSSVDYEISPVKENYNVGDEVTITLNDHNSYYRTLNNFLGWSDGSTENPRTITLDGPVELTAVYESVPVFNYIDFSRLTKNDNNMVSYEADIFADEANKAVVTMMFADSIEGNPYVAASADGYKFQGRPAKFGEDPEEMRIPCITRRTTAQRRGFGKMDYVCISFSTKDLTDVNVSALVGTDNFCYKTQNLECSLDGENWTAIGTIELETREADFAGTPGLLAGWADLNGTLPAEAENQEKVYVRIISDPASEAITNPAAGELDLETVDAFEYVGSILITSGSSQGINEVSRAIEANAPVYNLMGIRVNNTQKGLLIQGGKKFIVK